MASGTKKKGKKEEEVKDISKNKILVRVYKDFGSNTQILKAQYEAVERRDIYNNLVSINKDYAHNEDTDFSISDVYREMQIILEFKNKPLSDKLEILQKKIEFQDKLLRLLEKHPKLNAMFNFCDEDLKSRDYKILKNHIKNHDGEGAYFTIENGLRVYSFMACDGYLAPIWHGIDRYTQYPDHTRKLKITVQEDMRMREEIRQYNREKLVGNILIWLAIIVGLLIGGNMFLGKVLLDKNAEIDKSLTEASLACNINTLALNNAYGKLIKEKLFTEEEQKIEQKVEELKPNSLG